MKATGIWPLVALFAVTVLPATAAADARDYPGRLGDGPRLRNSGRADFGHGHNHRPQRVPASIPKAHANYLQSAAVTDGEPAGPDDSFCRSRYRADPARAPTPSETPRRFDCGNP